MLDRRPFNRNLFFLRFTVSSIVSILHRISGILLFFMIPFFLLLLQQSLVSNDNFIAIKSYFSFSFVKFFLFLVLNILFYHMIAGIRHLFMDLGYFETKSSGSKSAKFVIFFVVVLSLFLGAFLW